MIVPREQLVEWLNSIEWLRPEQITPQAEALIADHLAKIRTVIKDVMAKKGVNAVEAHGIAQTAGHDTPEGESLLDDLFSKVLFRGAGVRESLIANIVAGYCWDFDSELCNLPNPWLPLIELYGMGYTTSGDDDPDGNGLTLLVGYKDNSRAYRIV
jgi:hypothetical protein